LRVLRQRPLKEAPAYILGRIQTIVIRVKRKGAQLDYRIRLRLQMSAITRNEQAVHHRAAALYRPTAYDRRVLLLRRAVRHERGAGGERGEFVAGKAAVERGHAAIGAGKKPLRRDEAQRAFDRRGDLFRRLAALLATSIAPSSTSLPWSSANSSIGTRELAHS